MMSKSCVGCKYLYGNGRGYSNYTWMETFVECALDKNPNLITGQIEEPYNWNKDDPEKDNFAATQNSRCECYAPGPYFTADPDREDDPCDPEYGLEPEVAKLIRKRIDWWPS